jgi:aromatic ring-opening dioxygenase catalytic subunit (LigB family)
MDWSWGPADTWKATEGFLKSLPALLPEPPKAMVVISAHWEEMAFTASAAVQPELIYDYSGFPAHTYQLTWPAPGEPALAGRVVDLLTKAGLPAVASYRGFDHGVFIPMKVAFPEAVIPTVSLSLAVSAAGNFDPEVHLAAGRALAALRDEGILIVASGMSFHNLRGYFQPQTLERSREFDNWLTAAVESPAVERNRLLAKWAEAPSARYAHPREEHLIPLLVAAGAGGDAAGHRLFYDEPMGAALSAYVFGDHGRLGGSRA